MVSVKAKVSIGEIENVDSSEAFVREKLSLVLALYKAKNFEDGVDIARKLVEMGGWGIRQCFIRIKSKMQIVFCVLVIL